LGTNDEPSVAATIRAIEGQHKSVPMKVPG